MTTIEQAMADVHPSPRDRWGFTAPPALVGHRRAVLGAIGGGAVTLAVLAAVDGGAALLALDEPITRWIASSRTPTLTSFFNTVSRAGDNIVVFTLAASLMLATLRRCRLLAAAIVVAVLARPAMEFVLKATVGRTRPDIAPLADFHGPSHPSGHPMAAASLYGMVPAVVALHTSSRALRRAVAVAAVVLVVLVAAARVYKSAHYLTDVLGSLAWISLYLALVYGAMDRLHPRTSCRCTDGPDPRHD